jgi:predicted permease
MHLLAVFSENLLPVFLAAGCGALLIWRTKVDPRAVSSIAFHIFSPALMYDLIVTHQATGWAFARQSLAALVTLGGPAVVVWGLCRWRGVSRTRSAAAVLLASLPNAGNYGLSVAGFAFGDAVQVEATLYFVASAIWSYTAGVFVASLGRVRVQDALLSLLRVPALWGVAIAFVRVESGVALPLPVERTIGLLADACIPTFLVLLGMQLVRYGGRVRFGRLMALGIGGRLVLGPLLGIALASWLAWEEPVRRATILQAGMPTAVVSTILATEYDIEPGMITRGVVISTLISPLTLTPLLAWLGA